MKLKKYLEGLSDDTIVSIGAINGSGYMYIGRAGDVDMITKVFENYREHKIKELGILENDIKKLAYATPEITDVESTDDRNVVEYVETLCRARTKHKNMDKYIRKYKSPLGRSVVDSSRRIDEIGYRIIIEGRETGDFWLKSEFDEKYNI